MSINSPENLDSGWLRYYNQNGLTLAVSQESWNAAAGGGGQAVLVTSNTIWTAESGAAWLSAAPAGGTRDGDFTITAEANTATTERVGTITVRAGELTRTITVTQPGAIPPVDKTALAAAIAVFSTHVEANYTPTSWAAALAAYNAAVIVNANAAATQTEVDAATLALTNAITALVFSGPSYLQAFPDLNFRQVTLGLLNSVDGGNRTAESIVTEADQARMADMTYWNLNNRSIADLTGIAYFTGLRTLHCSFNQLETLDITQNLALQYLGCYDNRLSALDVTKNTALIQLYCLNNELTTLDVTQNPVLQYLDCGSNKLTTLDVKKNPALEHLLCFNNQLTTLDVTQNPALTELSCGNNDLITFDITQNPALRDLSCDNSKLTTLDVTKNPALNSLYCHNNELTTLDVSQNPALRYLYCYNNKLTTLDVTQNPALFYFYCNNNQLTALDVTQNPTLNILFCFNNYIPTLDHVTGWRTLGLTINTPENPDIGAFRFYNQYALTLAVSPESWRPAAGGGTQAVQVTSNTVWTAESGAAWLSLAPSGGIRDGEFTITAEANTATTERVGTIVVRAGEATRTITVTQPGATPTVDKTALATAITVFNTLAEANYTPTSWAAALAAYNAAVIVNANDAATQTEVDSATLALTNAITALVLRDANYAAVDAAIAAANALDRNLYVSFTAVDAAIAAVVRGLDITQQATVDGFAAAINAAITALVFSGSSYAQAFPDLNFRQAVLALLNTDGGNRTASSIVTEADKAIMAARTSLDVSNRSIEDLTGIAYFTGLVTLHCESNRLTSLDLRQNPELQTLYCQNNELASLNVTQNPELRNLYCENNQMASLDLSKNTRLLWLNCGNNKLTGLDLSDNAALEGLYCYSNLLVELDLSGNAGLLTLNCSDNLLTKLNLTNNAKLSWLNCNINKLSGLDLSKNAALEGLHCVNNLLVELNLSDNAKLDTLSCSDNRLTKLDVTGLPLQYINCSYNNMKDPSDVIGFTGIWDNVNFIFFPQNNMPQQNISLDSRLIITPSESILPHSPEFFLRAESAISGYLYVAAYNARGLMVEILTKSFALEAGESIIIGASVTYSEDLTYKFFIWDDDFMPLCAITSVDTL